MKEISLYNPGIVSTSHTMSERFRCSGLLSTPNLGSTADKYQGDCYNSNSTERDRCLKWLDSSGGGSGSGRRRSGETYLRIKPGYV